VAHHKWTMALHPAWHSQHPFSNPRPPEPMDLLSSSATGNSRRTPQMCDQGGPDSQRAYRSPRLSRGSDIVFRKLPLHNLRRLSQDPFFLGGRPLAAGEAAEGEAAGASPRRPSHIRHLCGAGRPSLLLSHRPQHVLTSVLGADSSVQDFGSSPVEPLQFRLRIALALGCPFWE
jgi:hypothetical protein